MTLAPWHNSSRAETGLHRSEFAGDGSMNKRHVQHVELAVPTTVGFPALLHHQQLSRPWSQQTQVGRSAGEGLEEIREPRDVHL